jgi:hypothetical protein
VLDNVVVFTAGGNQSSLLSFNVSHLLRIISIYDYPMSIDSFPCALKDYKKKLAREVKSLASGG